MIVMVIVAVLCGCLRIPWLACIFDKGQGWDTLAWVWSLYISCRIFCVSDWSSLITLHRHSSWWFRWYWDSDSPSGLVWSGPSPPADAWSHSPWPLREVSWGSGTESGPVQHSIHLGLCSSSTGVMIVATHPSLVSNPNGIVINNDAYYWCRFKYRFTNKDL